MLAGPRLGWGRRGLGEGARKKDSGAAGRSEEPCIPPPTGAGQRRLGFTERPPHTSKQKLHGRPKDAPSPRPAQRRAHPRPDPGREGEGSRQGRKKGARLPGEARRGQGQLPPPAPRRPTRAAGLLSPRIMHGPGAPPAQRGTVGVRGGPESGGQEGGVLGAQPRALGAGWRGRGEAARAHPRLGCSTSEAPRRNPGRPGRPLAISKLPVAWVGKAREPPPLPPPASREAFVCPGWTAKAR